MPQIAQQDYVRLSIADLSNLTEDEKKKIRDLHERGILMDALLEVADGDLTMRVVTDAIGEADTVIVFNEEGTVVKLDVAEQI